MESQSETTQTVSALKLPILKTGDYDLWSMRMEQYLTHTDYALWRFIVNGDAPACLHQLVLKGPIPPKTAEQKLARKNELKAKSTLLLAIPDEHLLKFHRIKNAKTLWETIKTRSEGLDKTNDRFQKLISQLEIHVDLYELSMDDLYNNLKVYEAEIKSIKLKLKLPSKWSSFFLTYAKDMDPMAGGHAYMRRCHFARECRAPRNHENRNGYAPKRILPVETPANALVVDAQTRFEAASKSPMIYLSQEQDLKQTKQVYGKALTKLVKKVKHLEDQLKSTTKRRKAKVVISDEEEDLVSKDPSKQGRMLETEYEDVETEHAKEESSKVHLDVLTAVMALMLGRRLQVEEDSEVARDLIKAHSPVRRDFNQKSAAKTNNLNEKVKTARVNNVTTAGSKAIVNAAVGNGENASFLKDYQEVLIGKICFHLRNPKGGKIIGKGKIRTGKLDFEDVYFVKELKFNIFSVSQMCDKKNSVLFTETECLNLSPDFRLLDEKRLGHINFKTMNKLVRGNLVRGFPSKLFENDHTYVACQRESNTKLLVRPSL
ncbi:hypothetical protein Tco_0449844 [Tanacetum coccineum]